MYPPGAPPDKSSRTSGPGTPSSPRRRSATRQDSRSVLGWDKRPIRSTLRGLFSPRMARTWSTPRATSPSTPTPRGRRWSTAKKLVQFLPPDIFAWDDASNNKWLISGKGALIMNPPSAWAVAKRDNPKVAEQLWTFPSPEGPARDATSPASRSTGASGSSRRTKLPRRACSPICPSAAPWSSWSRRAAATTFLPSRACATSRYGPRSDHRRGPCTTIHRAAIRSCHLRRSRAACNRHQMYAQATTTKMIAKFTQGGESMDKVIAWASSELEGFMRV